MHKQFTVETLQQTEEAGFEIAQRVQFPACVYLNGSMGAGKTTLCKAILEGLGYVGAVTSPTYNLIQEYRVPSGMVYHMDLYRLEDPAELEYLALSDLWVEDTLFLVEWPQNGKGFLPPPTYEIDLGLFCDHGISKREIILKSIK